MPAQKPRPAPVITPARSSGVSVSRVTAFTSALPEQLAWQIPLPRRRGPAITPGDLAGLTSEEFGELWDVVGGKAAAWADRLLKVHTTEN